MGRGQRPPLSRIVLLMLVLAGCSSTPAELAYSPESALLAYPQALTLDKQLIGQPVRWSGLIVASRVKADHTEIELVYLPLRSNGIPQQQEQSPGRFLVHVTGLLDPQLYAAGRSFSVLGTLKQWQYGQIGEQPYQFPVVDAQRYKLWPKLKEVEVRYVRDPFDDWLWPPRP